VIKTKATSYLQIGERLRDPALLKSKCYIDGEWIRGPLSISVTNPADQSLLGHVPKLGNAETKHAINAAKIAQKGWAKKTAKERAVILRRWFDLIVENTEDLAQIMTAEQGKPLSESRGEIAYGASFIEFYAEEAKRVYGEVVPSPWSTARMVVIKQPVGVVAAITPWNFPNAMITRKAGPALAAGCAFVCKPANETPFSALALAELADRAGIPAGIFSVITGDSRAIGAEMTSNAAVGAFTFTGSTEVGRILMAQCAPTIKKLGLELGGNAPFIVFDDADLDAAVVGAIASKYRNAGQTCVCANRLLVQERVYDSFVEKLSAAVRKLKVGNGVDHDITMGPLINTAAVKKVSEHIADALKKGGTIVSGGKQLSGNFFGPTILRDATNEMLVYREETFGPLAPVFKFKSEDEAVAMANDTEFGLASYFYTRDLGRVWRVSEALEYGMVGVNAGIISTAEAPFGGMKQSGIGREGSRHGMEEYLEMKYVLMGGLEKVP
jgi:succinate-semialdehyde dehydrogenase / glutarate-semialdehyde dehydrogenase